MIVWSIDSLILQSITQDRILTMLIPYVYHVHSISLLQSYMEDQILWYIHVCVCIIYLYIMCVDVVSLLQSNTQDQILLQWEGGDSATMHVLVVHAMIILLTYGPPNGKCMQEMIAVIEKKYTEWPQMIVLTL